LPVVDPLTVLMVRRSIVAPGTGEPRVGSTVIVTGACGPSRIGCTVPSGADALLGCGVVVGTECRSCPQAHAATIAIKTFITAP
jgi:hypothetical protein